MRVNINLLPRQDVQYDLWAPLLLGFKPNPNTHIKGTSQEILEVFKNISKLEPLEIYNNGEPPAWAELVVGILQKHGYEEVSVHPGNDREYFNNPSKLFPDIRKPYRIEPIGDLQQKIYELFEFYKTQQWSIEEPKQGVCGHYYQGKTKWTQIQHFYNTAESDNNKPLMSKMLELTTLVTALLKNIFAKHNTVIDDLDNKLTLRLLDYVNTPDLNPSLSSHLDATIMTVLLAHNAPSLHVTEFTDDTLTQANSIKKEISKELFSGNCVLSAGYAHASEMKSYVSPCWHGVHVPTAYPRRLSMVVMISSIALRDAVRGDSK